MEGDDIFGSEGGHIEPSTPFDQSVDSTKIPEETSRLINKVISDRIGFCLHLSPQLIHIDYDEKKEVQELHVCTIKQRMGLENTTCAFSTRAFEFGEAAYDYNRARNCPCYTTDPFVAEGMISLLQGILA